MNATTTTAPALPDAILRDIAAVLEARRDAADGKTYYADTWPTIGKLCATIADALADAEARGRAAALAEVDAALDRLHDHADITFVAIDRAVIGRPVPRWSCECLPNRGTYSVEDTPTAAILAAAAALGGDA